MKRMILTICILFFTNSYSQSEIKWDGTYQLQLSDFQSLSTKIGNGNVNNIVMPCGMDFNFSMSNIEFMFTKNFNSKVNNTFKKDASSIIAIDKESAKKMLDFAQYLFDLSELYARKLRKKIFEEKKVLSNISFLKPIYDDLQIKFTESFSNSSNETNLGSKKDKLKILHEEVLKEIEVLSGFCKECKPPKVKK